MWSILFIIIITTPLLLSNAQVQKITSILGEPFLMLKGDHTGFQGNEKYEGFSKDLADKLSARLNFTYVLSLVLDNKYGRLTRGSWNGMIGELVEETADLCIAPVTITKERREAVDFSTPFLEFQLAILLRKPGFGPDGGLLLTNASANHSTNIFNTSRLLRPITSMLWIILITTIVSLICISFAIEICVGRNREKALGVSYAGTAFQFVFWGFVLLFLIVYTGAFVSDRMVSTFGIEDDTSMDIQSITDLANQDNIKYGVVRAGSTFDYLRISPDRILRRIYSRMTSEKLGGLPRTIEEGISKVRYGIQPYAFIVEGPYAQYLSGLKPCNVIIAPNYFGPKKTFAVASKPDHPLRSKINEAVLQMKEKGELEKLERKWFQNSKECPAENLKPSKIKDDKHQLGIEDMMGVLVILPVSAIFAILIAIVEICVARKKNRADISGPGIELKMPRLRGT